mmetsp:Transcript_42890/g.101831  ORF Transcript_42890/g.101831 Transcript_42890/m.101831 type:complete len:220 (-) Transcript_42890:958-1617(-)
MCASPAPGPRLSRPESTSLMKSASGRCRRSATAPTSGALPGELQAAMASWLDELSAMLFSAKAASVRVRTEEAGSCMPLTRLPKSRAVACTPASGSRSLVPTPRSSENELNASSSLPTVCSASWYSMQSSAAARGLARDGVLLGVRATFLTICMAQTAQAKKSSPGSAVSAPSASHHGTGAPPPRRSSCRSADTDGVPARPPGDSASTSARALLPGGAS